MELLFQNSYFFIYFYIFFYIFLYIKNYVKNISPATYEDLKITINKIIKNKIKKEHLKNYFKYLFIQAKEYIDTHK